MSSSIVGLIADPSFTKTWSPLWMFREANFEMPALYSSAAASKSFILNSLRQWSHVNWMVLDVWFKRWLWQKYIAGHGYTIHSYMICIIYIISYMYTVYYCNAFTYSLGNWKKIHRPPARQMTSALNGAKRQVALFLCSTGEFKDALLVQSWEEWINLETLRTTRLSSAICPKDNSKSWANLEDRQS